MDFDQWETTIQAGLNANGTRELPVKNPNCAVELKPSAGPLLQKLWKIALDDIEANIVETERGQYFGAGAHFGVRVYTRDISFSGVLGLNMLYPEIMRRSLDLTRELRWELGFGVAKGYEISAIDAPWNVIVDDEREMSERYHTNSYARRTDDVIWLWAAADLLHETDADRKDWEWLYDWGKRFFGTFYAPFFDPQDGLYRGQSTFVDITFVQHEATGYPAGWSIEDCITCKATSTNALYVKGLDVMAEAARKLGRREADEWQRRADTLRAAMRRELLQADGTFAYLKDRHGRLDSRRHNLSEALAVLFGVVRGEDARRAMAGYPYSDKGVPLYHPFHESSSCYHNNSSWPFADSIFFKALSVADGKEHALDNLAILSYSCLGTFHELTDYRTHEVRGSEQQLWSAAGLVDLCRRANLVSSR